MFKDYYKILEISSDADYDTIKDAYRKQALKWHPDKHPNMDVKSIMQDINEAYAILKDPQKRTRYDQEYKFFRNFQSDNSEKKNDRSYTGEQSYNQQHSSRENNDFWHEYYYEYDVKNEDLKEDIRSAREYATKLVDEFFSELKRNSKLAAEGAWEGAKGYIYGLIFLIIIGFLIKTCVA